LYYELGADYVLQPHVSSGMALGEALQGKTFAQIKKWKMKDLQRYGKKT
jgi:hypothetical protein